MSALFGIVRFDSRPVLEIEIESMAEALASHGGDVRSIWKRANAGLGHHLRIVTPEDRAERQPVRHPSGHHLLNFCGRLDNRKDLLNKLGNLHGALLDSSSVIPDSAIVAAAFEQWGLECASRLCGDFVFAAWLEREQRIVIFRAPLSCRTLFYFWDGVTLAFSTSPIGLFALRFIRKDLDRERLADYMVHAPIEDGHSFFCDMRILESGTALTVDKSGLRTESFWNPEELPELRLKNDEEYLEGYLELFDQAVEARLRSAFPLSAMMSGGLDSSSVVCTAAPMLEKEERRIYAFTQIPREGFQSPNSKGEYSDETPFVEAIARKYENVDLRLVSTEIQCLLGGHSRFICAAGAPFRNMANRAWIEEILCQAQAAGSRAILTGSMGNIAFSWDGDGMIPGLIRRGRLVEAWRQAKAFKRTSTLRAFVRRGILPLLPDSLWLSTMRRLTPRDPSISGRPTWAAISPLRTEVVRSLRVDERAHDKGFSLLWRNDLDKRKIQARFLREHERLGSEIWCGLHSLYGVEERDPMSDRRLVEFCLSIPDDQFQRDGISRRLTRCAMAGRWPPEIALNTGRGEQDADWHALLMATRSELQLGLDRLYSSPLANELLDLDRIQRVLSGIADAPPDCTKTFVDAMEILYLGLGLGQFFEWIEAPSRI